MLRLTVALMISTLIVSANGGGLSRTQLVRASQSQEAGRAVTRAQTTQGSLLAVVDDVTSLQGGTGVRDSETRPMAIVDLATGVLNAQASDINDKGEVVGFTVSNDQLLSGFLWRGASVITLPTVGGSWAQPMAINNLGQVVGYGPVGPGGQGQHNGYLWQDGAMTETAVAGCAVVPSDINNRSQVVGSLWCEGSRMGFIWQNGQLTTLELDTDYGFAEALNDEGDVVGGRLTDAGTMHAFTMVDGVTADLPPLDPASNHSEAQDINESGVVVGNSLSASYWGRAVRWTDGAIQDLWTGDPLTHSNALAVNDAGEMAGYVVLNRGGGPTQAIAWGKDGIKSLETLGGEGTQATDVNSAGIVSGAAQDASGAWHAVLWIDYPSLVKMTEALVKDHGVRKALVRLLDGASRAAAAGKIQRETKLLAAYGRLLQTEATAGVSKDDAATLIFLSTNLSTAPTQARH